MEKRNVPAVTPQRQRQPQPLWADVKARAIVDAAHYAKRMPLGIHLASTER